jgi:hypothetical protein
MRRSLTLAALTLAVAACKRPEAPPRQVAGAPVPAAAPAAGDRGEGQVLRGKVLEKIDVAQYSYLKLATASGATWTAVPRTDRKVGDEVGVRDVIPMQGFESKELNRKFDVVYFGALASPGGDAALVPPATGVGAMGGGEGAPGPAGMAAQHRAVVSGPSDVTVEKVAKAEGADARTVEEIWAQRQKLKGKAVTVRGQVVKFMPVMGKNFLHLRDGSGNSEKKDNDLTVTTATDVAMGDVVIAKGTLAVDRDFGAGYVYPVIVEDAKVSK